LRDLGIWGVFLYFGEKLIYAISQTVLTWYFFAKKLCIKYEKAQVGQHSGRFLKPFERIFHKPSGRPDQILLFALSLALKKSSRSQGSSLGD
jgi:hypothetical protein